MIVRRGTLADFEEVLAWTPKAMRENPLHASIDAEKLRRNMQRVFEIGYVLCLVDTADRVLGSVGLMAGEPVWFAKTVYLVENWLWVLPEGRQAGGAKLLFEALKSVAAQARLPVLFSPWDVGNLPALERLYGMYGARRIGGVLVLEG